jgi:hypothetical protein
MGSIYEARWKNALKIADRINNMIFNGYKVFNKDGDVQEAFIIEDNKIKQYDSFTGVMLGWFENDPDLDNGSNTPIKEYSAYFKDWTAVHPKYIKRIMK